MFEDLIEFKAFVEEITSSNSRLFKEAVLTKYKDNANIKYYLNFIFNPYITTGISDKKWKAVRTATDGTSWYEGKYRSVKDVLEYLKLNNTGRFETLKEVFAYMCLEVPVDLWYLYEAIVTKNLQLGVEAKTINKIIPKLIPQFSVQLANKYFDKPNVLDGKHFMITTKIDGTRIIAIKDHGQVKFYTRQGQEYIGLVDLEAELKKNPLDNFVLDGELVAIDTEKEVTYKNTMKLSRTKDNEKHGLRMLVFDCLSVEEFQTQTCNHCYAVRRQFLDNIFKPWETMHFGGNWQSVVFQCGGIYYGIEIGMYYFRKLPVLYAGDDTSKVIELLEEQTAQGEEGIMINIADAKYAFGRTNNLLKVKKFNDCDLRIVGFEEGDNKLTGTLGSLLLEYKGNTVGCGSGIPDELRDEIWANKDKYLGKIAEIKYFEETTNQKGGTSIRFPVFKDIRFDKTEPNY